MAQNLQTIMSACHLRQEGTVLSEISQKQEGKCCVISTCMQKQKPVNLKKVNSRTVVEK